MAEELVWMVKEGRMMLYAPVQLLLAIFNQRASKAAVMVEHCFVGQALDLVRGSLVAERSTTARLARHQLCAESTWA